MRLNTFIFTVILAAGSLSAQTPPVPAVYQDLYNSLNTQITAFDATVKAGWNGSSYPYLDAPQLLAANSDSYTQLLGTNYYQYAVSVQLSELQALGAKAITIHINFPIFYQPFHTYAGNSTFC